MLVQNFTWKLKEHILACLLHGDNTTCSFSNDECAKLTILQDKLYFQNTITVNYTTYNS